MNYISFAMAFICGLVLMAESAFACQATAIGVAFGRYLAIGSQPSTGVGMLRLNCTRPALVRLSAGLHSQGASNSRFLESTGGSGHLRYNLYLDPSAVRIWGDGSANTFVQPVPTGMTNLQIYAVIPGGQRVQVGNYSDMITVIIDW